MPIVNHNDAEIYYVTEGDSENPPLFLLHWFLGSHRTWYDIGWVRQLKPYFYLVIIDHRGYGRSSKFYEPSAYSPRRHVGDIQAVLNAEGIDNAHFFGYSMGARIGFTLAAYVPDVVQSLVLGGMHPYSSDEIPTDLDERIELLGQGMAPLLEAYGIGPKQVFDRMLKNDARALQADVIQTKQWPDLSGELSDLESPVLVFVGQNDGFYDGARRISHQLSNGRFVAFPNENHRTAFLKRQLLWPHLKRFYDL